MQVGSSSPFPLYQHSASPRYHPHSQREDHGDVEYEEEATSDTKQVNMPNQGEKTRERPENEERGEPTHPKEDWEDQRQGALARSEESQDLPDETYSPHNDTDRETQPEKDGGQQPEQTADDSNTTIVREETKRDRDATGEEGGRAQEFSVDEQQNDQQSELHKGERPKDVDDKGSEGQVQQEPAQDQTSQECRHDQNDDVEQTRNETSAKDESEQPLSNEKQPDVEDTAKDSEEGYKESDKGWTRVEHEEDTSSSSHQQDEGSFEKPTMSLAEQFYHSELPPEESQPEVEKDTDQRRSITTNDEDKEMASSPFPNLKNEPLQDRVSEKSDEATQSQAAQSHRKLVPVDESFHSESHQKEKRKHKEDHHHTFIAQANNDYGKTEYHHDNLNQPNPRAENPPVIAYAAPAPSDMGLRRQEGGGEMNVFQTEDRGRVHHQGESLPPNYVQRAQWDKSQHQAHHQYQHGLQQTQEQLAHVSLVGMAAVTVECQPNLAEENIDFDLERERLARLQSETARLHGGVIPKDSDVSFAQSEIEKKQRQHQQEASRQFVVEQVIVPIAYEGTYVVPIEDRGNDPNDEESKRLHDIHDHIVQEIKTGAHVDTFDKK